VSTFAVYSVFNALLYYNLPSLAAPVPDLFVLCVQSNFDPQDSRNAEVLFDRVTRAVSWKQNVGALAVALDATGTAVVPPPAPTAFPGDHGAHGSAALSHLFNHLLLCMGLENLTSGDRTHDLTWSLIGTTSASVQQGIAARVKTGTGVKEISTVRATLSVHGYCGSRTVRDGGGAAQANPYLRSGRDKCGLDNDFLRDLLTSASVPAKAECQIFKGVQLATINFADELRDEALSDVGVVVYSLLGQLGDSLIPDMLCDRSAPFFKWLQVRPVQVLAQPHVNVEVAVVDNGKGRKRQTTSAAGSGGIGSLASSEVGITPSGVTVYDSTYLEGDGRVLAGLDVEVWATWSRGIGSGLIVIFNAPVDTESSTCSVQQTRGGAFAISCRVATAQEQTISSFLNLCDLHAVDAIITAQVPSSFYEREPLDSGDSFLSSASTASSPGPGWDDSLDTTLHHERAQFRDLIFRQDRALRLLRDRLARISPSSSLLRTAEAATTIFQVARATAVPSLPFKFHVKTSSLLERDASQRCVQEWSSRGSRLSVSVRFVQQSDDG